MRDETLRKLAAHFVNELSDRYANDGCNDFELDMLVPDVEERRAIMREFEEMNGTPQDFDPNGSYEMVSNFCVADLVSTLLEKGQP